MDAWKIAALVLLLSNVVTAGYIYDCRRERDDVKKRLAATTQPHDTGGWITTDGDGGLIVIGAGASR